MFSFAWTGSEWNKRRPEPLWQFGASCVAKRSATELADQQSSATDDAECGQTDADDLAYAVTI